MMLNQQYGEVTDMYRRNRYQPNRTEHFQQRWMDRRRNGYRPTYSRDPREQRDNRNGGQRGRINTSQRHNFDYWNDEDWTYEHSDETGYTNRQYPLQGRLPKHDAHPEYILWDMYDEGGYTPQRKFIHQRENNKYFPKTVVLQSLKKKRALGLLP